MGGAPGGPQCIKLRGALFCRVSCQRCFAPAPREIALARNELRALPASIAPTHEHAPLREMPRSCGHRSARSFVKFSRLISPGFETIARLSREQITTERTRCAFLNKRVEFVRLAAVLAR